MSRLILFLGTVHYNKVDGITYEVSSTKMFKHDDYDKDVNPKYLYDVGLIKLPEMLTLSKKIHTVALWTEGKMTSNNTS